jgi:hypothetical protein
MKYGILTIDTPNANLGNRLIEYAVKTLANLPAPAVAVSMFEYPSAQEIVELNKCDFVLLPGSTILATGQGQGEATAALSKIKVPKFCTAASFWGPTYPLNKEILKYITPPIGVRDPATLAACRNLGISAILVGCPTAYFPKRKWSSPIPYNIVGFARTHVPWQLSCLSKIPGKIVASIQERHFELPMAIGLHADAIYYDNPDEVMNVYAGTQAVYTGRLHSVLPALSQDKPVYFFGDPADSRFSLLDLFGIIINPLGKTAPMTLQNPSTYRSIVDATKSAFMYWCEKTIKRIT